MTVRDKIMRNLGALSEGNFRLFFLGQGISQLGDWINRVGLIILIHTLTGEPAAVAGLLLAQMLPRLFVLPLGGLLADRWPKRRLMLATDLIRALLALGFFLAHLMPSSALAIWYVYTNVVLLQVFTAIFNPARSAAIPSLVTTERLAAANALIAVTGQSAMLLGPALGGLIVVVWGGSAVFVVNALSFLWSAAFLWFMRLAESPHSAGVRKPLIADLRGGAAALVGNRPLQACFAAMFLTGAANICLNVAIIDLLTGTLGRPSAALGPLLTLVGLGMIIAGAPVVWLLRRVPAIPFIGGAVLLLGMDLAFIGATNLFTVVAAAFVVNGILSASIDVSCETSIQRLVSPDRLGRVFGLFIWVATLGHVTGAACGGLLPVILGTPGTLVAVGATITAVTLVVFCAVLVGRGRALLAGTS